MTIIMAFSPSLPAVPEKASRFLGVYAVRLRPAPRSGVASANQSLLAAGSASKKRGLIPELLSKHALIE